MSRLALGTVQFGLPYGIANASGQVSREEAGRILRYANSVGIDTIDTAIAYGESERVLGQIDVKPSKVITKIPALPVDILDVEGWVQTQVQGALFRLGIPSLYGILLHRAADLRGGMRKSLIRSLNTLKSTGVVQKIGASVYAPSELDDVFEAMPADIIQAPLNVIDRRLETSGWLRRLRDQSVEVHLRSTFLQGLLLMPRLAIPAKFERWSKIWDAWSRTLTNRKVSAISACLDYPLSLDGVSRVVVGVDSVAHLKSLVRESAAPQPFEDFSEFIISEDELLINPSRWGEL